ncbi:ribosomal protein S5 domain 2-type protein [Fimicolochytrium jonesii]|uniref:ribosomal protein S5 domain 2-type protein n=1 Tax=Fimicolochytrium jonesii TaxID=1396493 RepID=UPI0022FE6E0F|nr:ribosomal protein S5 domain 2-type protein [Fimicolochytrium jonesii]KAI8827175.1 ribosomal protein S5 domain 2-type protein [Fimicolochytrium jonesii]
MTASQNAILASAPGKVILFGEHAVVYEKPAIAASLALRTYAWLEPTHATTAGANPPLVRLRLPDICPDPIEWDSGRLETLARLHGKGDNAKTPTPEALSSLAEVVILESLAQLQSSPTTQAAAAFLHLYLCICWRHQATPKPLPPIEICVRSALPVGAGLGSSASYSVAIATALLAYSGHLDGGNLTTTDMDLINGWAFMAEKVIHGNPSGIDNALATYGGAKLYTKGKLETVDGFSAFRFLLTDTQVPKNTKKQVEGFRTRKERYPAVMNHLIEAVEGIALECRRLFEAKDQNSEHVSQDEVYEVMETLIDMNHSIMAASGVSHPSLESVRQITALHGLRSKLTGAGGGGCALTLIRHDTTRETLDTIKTSLTAQGFRCYETEVGCPGVRISRSPGKDGDVRSRFWAGEGVEWRMMDEGVA